MVDQSFAVAVRTYENHPEKTSAERVACYFGVMTLICPFCYGFTLMGVLVGQALTGFLSLDFAVPVCFIARAAPLLRTGPQQVAASVSAVASLCFAWLP